MSNVAIYQRTKFYDVPLEVLMLDLDINLSRWRASYSNVIDDKRLVVGVLSTKTDAIRSVVLPPAVVRLETEPKLKIKRGHIDSDVLNKLKDAMTNKCDVCHIPAEYSLHVTRYIIMDSGPGYSNDFCETHIPETVAEGHEYHVTKWESPLHALRGKIIKKGNPEKPIVPKISSFQSSIDGKSIAKYDTESGILQVAGANDISFPEPQDIDLKVIGEGTIPLKGVKEIKRI